MKKLTPPKPALNTPVHPDKWAATRQRERIEPKTIPHINSTMRAPYLGHELTHRGRTPCPNP